MKRPPKTAKAPASDRPAEGAPSDDEKREQKRLVVRTAAYKRFSERGYNFTTVDDICEEAKISKGSFYWYYDSKQAVLLAIVDGWALDVEVALNEHFRSSIESQQRRRAVTESLQALSRKLSRLMPLWLEFLSQAQREPAIREGLQSFHRRVRRATHKLLTELVSGFESERESEALSTIIVGGFIGLMALELSDPDGISFGKNVAAFMDLLGHSSIEAANEPFTAPPATAVTAILSEKKLRKRSASEPRSSARKAPTATTTSKKKSKR